MRKLTEKDFWRRVDIKGPKDCWNWTGPRMARYGGFGRREYAHRASWRFNRGPIPDGLYVLHHCDNTLCVNPRHLYLGTQSDNISDVCNRNPEGLKHHISSRLSAEDILTIRELCNNKIVSQANAAGMYGVSPSYVWSILNYGYGDYTIRKES